MTDRIRSAVVAGWRGYLQVRGRTSRDEFWWFVAFCALVFLLCSAVDAGLGNHGPFGSRVYVVGTQIVTLAQYYQPGWLQVLAVVVLTPPLISVQVRRLHDCGVSGWWWWLTLLNVACGLGTWILTFAWYIRPGQPGSNRYGDPVTPTRTAS